MSWITLSDWRGMGAEDEAADEATATSTPALPVRKSPLEAMLNARRRMAELKERMERLSPSSRRSSSLDLDDEPAPLPPPPPPAAREPLPPPPPRPVYVPPSQSRIHNADLWKLVAVGALSGLLVSLLTGGRRR